MRYFFFQLLLFCVSIILTSSYRLIINESFKNLIRSKPISIISISILLTSPAFAVIDCKTDCYSNCVRVAPGSEPYCKSTCEDYCEQPDRQDGLSGSKDASRGETGLFGGLYQTTSKYIITLCPLINIDF